MKYLFIVLTILTCSCGNRSPHSSAGFAAIQRHFKEMNQTYNWQPESIGGSFYDHIVMLTATFMVMDESFSVEKTRPIIMKGVEKFLISINDNEKLILYLNHYPFTYKNLKYGVSIYTEKGEKLGYVSLIKGNLTFYKSDPIERLIEIHSEPYTQALEKMIGALDTSNPAL